MKKFKERFFCVTVELALLCAVVLACSSIPAPVSAEPVSPADELDAAIRETSDYLNKQLPKGNKLMILNVQSEFPALSEYIIDELIANTVNDRVFSVVDRQQLNTIRAELEFQTSGEVDDDTAQALGRMAGAQIIVSGAISRIGDLYRLRVRALSVQSAEIEGQFNRNIPDGPTVAALVRSQATGYGGVAAAPSGSGAGSGTAAAASVATLAQAQVPAQSVTVPVAPVYKIGDTGPAGGLIFYDKFSAAGGWRYLETAPQETEQELAWGRFANFDGTTTAIGGGKRNTELVVQAAKNLVTAARFCSDLEYGGYDDWFLPSKDELDLIYKNLKDKNLGSFSGDIYWSSSYSGGWDSGPWRQSFGDGNQRFDSVWTGSGGSNTYRVRAIRQF